MRENKLDAIYLESGSSMYYFTGQRTPGQAVILPAKSKSEPVWTAADAAKTAQALRNLGVATGKIGMEEQVRFATFDGLRREAPAVECVSANTGDGRLPGDQIAGRDRAAAARQRDHDRGLQGGARDAARRA